MSELEERMHSAIPTEYMGTQFRSRLEAKWAVFFDSVGWRWQYEPYDLRGYIPDFIVEFSNGKKWLVEVKPAGTWKELQQCAQELRSSLLRNRNDGTSRDPHIPGFEGDIIIAGSSIHSVEYMYEDVFRMEVPNIRVGGCIGVTQYGTDVTMFNCAVCGYTLITNEGPWGCKICDNLHHWGRGEYLSYEKIRVLFNKAGSKTQWHRR